jgi:hypothetical protein
MYTLGCGCPQGNVKVAPFQFSRPFQQESSNSLLFKAAGDSIEGMNDLSKFWPQDFSNIVWSYATAGEAHPKLFSKFGDHIIVTELQQFKPQDFSNIL